MNGGVRPPNSLLLLLVLVLKDKVDRREKKEKSIFNKDFFLPHLSFLSEEKLVFFSN